MLQIKTEIQGLLFVRVNICGCYLPSLASIHFLLNKIKDKRNKSNFMKCANETTIVLASKYYLPIHLLESDIYRVWHKKIDWAHISYADMNKVLTKNIALWCDLNGCSFSRVIQSLFTINWFGDLQDNIHPNWAKYQASLKYYFNRSLNIANELTESEYTFLKPSNADFVEYTNAKVFYSNFLSQCEPIAIEFLEQLFIDRIEKMSLDFFYRRFIPQIEMKLDFNRRANGLQLLTIRAMSKEAEFDKSLRRLCICEGCRQKYFTKQKGSTSSLCSSCQQRQKERKRDSRKKDRKGWTEDRIGACEGGCGSPRLKVNTSGSCLKCYLQSPLP